MSSINPNNINGSYPIAGQDNDSQGFRDNFTNIKNNLNFAKSEIEDLQSKVLLKAPLSGTTLNNNLANAQLISAQLLRATETVNNISAVSGSINVSWADAHFQYLSTTGSIVLNFSDWPTNNLYAKMRLLINVTNTDHTLTLPPEVTIGKDRLEGISGDVITFASTGQQFYEFSTYDNGNTVIVIDLFGGTP